MSLKSYLNDTVLVMIGSGSGSSSSTFQNFSSSTAGEYDLIKRESSIK